MSISYSTYSQDRSRKKIIKMITMHVFPKVAFTHINATPGPTKRLLISPHALPIARIIHVAILTAQTVQIETEAVLPTFAADLRLDGSRAVVVFKRPEATESVRAGAPAATDAHLVRAPSHAVARFDKGPAVHRCHEIADLAGDVVGGVRVDPGPRGAFFEQGYVRGVGRWEGESHGSQGEEDQGCGLHVWKSRNLGKLYAGWFYDLLERICCAILV